MIGPYPVFCRGHSGGRLVCEAFMRNGINMGHVTKTHKDSEFFSIRTNEKIREIILHAFEYKRADQALRARLQGLMKETVQAFVAAEIQSEGPFGWKIDPTLFTLPVLMEACPQAKAVHLIRDGRDVMLSRLNARIEHLDDPVNRLMVFGSTEVTTFMNRAISLDKTVKKLRTELEMQHWVTAVEFGLRGRQYGKRYLEVKYEDLCAAPLAEFEKIFAFLDVPFLEETKIWLAQAASANRIGKWKTLPPEMLALPLQLGGALLDKLGYFSSASKS